MKKTLASLAATVALAVPMTLVSAPAEAAGYCATPTQYRQIRNGMSLVRVQQIMRAPGYYIDGGVTGPRVSWQLRGWNKCGPGIFDYTVGFIRGPVAVTGHVGYYATQV